MNRVRWWIILGGAAAFVVALFARALPDVATPVARAEVLSSGCSMLNQAGFDGTHTGAGLNQYFNAGEQILITATNQSFYDSTARLMINGVVVDEHTVTPLSPYFEELSYIFPTSAWREVSWRSTYSAVWSVSCNAAPPQAQLPARNISQDCTERVEWAVEEALAPLFAPDAYDLSHGACVAVLTSHDAAPLAADLCREPRVRARIVERLGLIGPLNQGQCVQLLKPYLEQLFRPAPLAGAIGCPPARVLPGPPVTAVVEFQDTGPGLLYLSLSASSNAEVVIPSFPPDTTVVVTVSANRIDNTQPASFTIAVRIDTDAYSTVRFCYYPF